MCCVTTKDVKEIISNSENFKNGARINCIISPQIKECWINGNEMTQSIDSLRVEKVEVEEGKKVVLINNQELLHVPPSNMIPLICCSSNNGKRNIVVVTGNYCDNGKKRKNGNRISFFIHRCEI